MIDIEKICKKLKPILGKEADELWHTWLASDWKARKEIEIDIQIAAERHLKTNPLEDETILLPPPSEEQAKGDFILGKAGYRNRKLFPLYLKEEDFIKQIGLFSITGGGKTNVAMLLALQLLKKKIPFMVIDWKRQWRSILSLKNFPELRKVKVYTIGRDVVPFLWNPFRPPKGIGYKTWISVIIECLEKSHLAGLGVADFFMRIYEKLFKERKDENFYPNFYDGMNELMKIKPRGREFLWWQSTKRIMKSFCFGPASKSFNARHPLKLEELLDKPVILELDQEMPKPLRIFFMELIIHFIHLHRLTQGESDKKLRGVLFLEEIHNLFQKTKYENAKIDSLENVYREIRSFGQGVVSITQHPSLLPVYILGNSHTLIFLLLQHQNDIEAARRSIFLPREEEAYFNMLKTGQGIVKVMGRINPCHVKFLYVPVEKGKITDSILRIKAGSFLPSFHDGKTMQKQGFLPGDKNKPEKEGKKVKNWQKELLIDILRFPLSSTSKRYERLKINPKFGNRYKKDLVSEGLIKPIGIALRNCRIVLFEITQKGKAVLRDLGHNAGNVREGITHKFWKNKIVEYYKNKGCEVFVEKQINGKPDIIVVNHDKKIAVEIETGMADPIGNVEKCLKAGFDEIISVATNREVEEKIKEKLKERNLKQVKITSVFSFET